MMRINPDHKFRLLFAALVVHLALFPILGGGGLTAIISNTFHMVVLLAALSAASDTKRHFKVGVSLALPAMFGVWHMLIVERSATIGFGALVFLLAFYIYVITILLRAALKPGRVTGDTVYGALSVYLLMGMAFGLAFIWIENWAPGSFYVGDAQNPDGRLDGPELIYFSYVTLTTLGYGDITPVSLFARFLSFLESVTGVLYLAVLISRLVAQSLAQQADTKK